MKIFGVEITNQLREDAVVVIAISLLLIGTGQLLKRALDPVGSFERLERIEQRINQLEAGRNE